MDAIRIRCLYLSKDLFVFFNDVFRHKHKTTVTFFSYRNNLSSVEIRTKIIGHAKYVPIEAQKFTYLDLFRTWNLCLRTIFSFFVWFAAGLIYYGISQYVTFVGSNIYVATAILGLIQVHNCCYGFIKDIYYY